MATEAALYGRVTQRAPAVSEVHILWITAGLSCDGDSVSITAAMQPSIENVVMGAIPRLAHFGTTRALLLSGLMHSGALFFIFQNVSRLTI